MRRMHRIVLLAGLVALAPVLAGCENFDMDKLDVFGLNEKKKLPGDRKPVVPGRRAGRQPRHSAGIHQGQPAAAGDRANTAGRAGQPAAAAEPEKKTAAIEPAAEPKPKPKRKPKPRTATADRPQPKPSAAKTSRGAGVAAGGLARQQQQPQQQARSRLAVGWHPAPSRAAEHLSGTGRRRPARQLALTRAIN